MLNHELSVSEVAGFLSTYRYSPPERDGWFSSHEIQRGIRNVQGVRLLAGQVLPALTYLMDVTPPAIEDTWMLGGSDGNPITADQFQHPDIPKGARRFYRALGSAHNHVIAEMPIVAVNLAIQ